jgi:signal recognition particle GTPase
MNANVSQQILELIELLTQAEARTKALLQAARAQRFSFGLTYNYVDEDIAHLIGQFRQMRLMALHYQEERKQGN